MEKLSILTSDLLDIIFEYRNKNYGAYELRRTYPKRIMYALSATFLVAILFAGGAILASSPKHQVQIDSGPDVILAKAPDAPPPPPPPPPVHVDPPPPVALQQFTPPVIVPADEVDEPMPDIEKLETAVISTMTKEGTVDEGIALPEKPVAAVQAPKVNTDIDDRFTPVQIAAEFPGGTDGWTKYLRKNLNSDIPSQNGAPVGKYTVIISFVVSADGAISDVQAENDPGYGTKAEAIRVIVKGPHWNPAVQNGRKVVYRHKQSITFQVAEE